MPVNARRRYGPLSHLRKHKAEAVFSTWQCPIIQCFPLPVIRILSMLGEVETGVLAFGGDAEAERSVDEL